MNYNMLKKCLSCGAKKNLETDHIVPKTRGGKDLLNNTQDLCRRCNRAKHTRIIDFKKGQQLPNPKKCLRCLYVWVSFVDSPKCCPRCHSPYWKTTRLRYWKTKHQSRHYSDIPYVRKNHRLSKIAKAATA